MNVALVYECCATTYAILAGLSFKHSGQRLRDPVGWLYAAACGTNLAAALMS